MQTPSIFPPFWRAGVDQNRGYSQLQKEVDSLFENFARGFPDVLPINREGLGSLALAPKIDVSETDEQIEISAELPGIPEDAIEVSLTGNALTIKGEKKSEVEDKKKDYHVVERSYGTFRRVVQLPFDPANAEPHATFKDGVLRITVAKPAEAVAGTRRIEIKPSA